VSRWQLWSFPVRVLTAAFGVWVADLFVPVFRIDGSLAGRLLLGLTLAAFAFAATAALAMLFSIVLSGVLMVAATRDADLAAALAEEDPAELDDLAPGRPGDPEVRPAPSWVVTYLVGLGMNLLFPAVVSPAAFFFGVWVVRLVGAPVQMSGGWAAYLTAGLIASAVAEAARAGLVPPTRRTALRTWLAGRFGQLGLAVVLWLAIEFLDGVRLAPTDGRPVFAYALVLAVVFGELRIVLPGRVGLVAQAPANLLALWILAWLTGWMTSPLELDGWVPLVLVAVAVTAVTLPAALLTPTRDLPSFVRTTGRVRRRLSRPDPDLDR
jgi:hypothetical protein